MNSAPRARIGLISLGQGPRPEFDRLHRRLFAALGLDVDIVSRHALDGLSDAAIAALEARPGEAAIHSNVHGSGPIKSPLGAGWTAKWISRDALVPLMQAAIDDLEQTEAVDATICCVAEPFPGQHFAARRPFILPATVMLSYAQTIAEGRPDANIGLVVHGERQRAQQRAVWADLPWASRLNVQFAQDGQLEQAIDDLAARQADLILLWAYAAGLGPNDAQDRLTALATRTRAPIVVPAVATVMFTRNLLSPPLVGAETS